MGLYFNKIATHFRVGTVVAAVLFTFAFESSSIAAGQFVAPSLVTPQTLLPEASSPRTDLKIDAAAALAAPPGAEKLDITIGSIVVEGDYPQFDSGVADLTSALVGKKITVAQIFDLANTIEQTYARSGYVLVRVVVPPQRLKQNSQVKLLVVDGFIEAVKTDGVPERVRDVVNARMAGLIGRRQIKLEDIEHTVMIASDLPGLKLKSTLAKGKQPDGTLLILEGEHQLFSGSVTTDNHLPDSLGVVEWSSSLSVNSALGIGEQFYTSLGSGYDLNKYGLFQPPTRLIGGGFIVPIGPQGWTVNPEYTKSRTQPTPAAGTPQTIGVLDRWTLRSTLPLILNRSENLSATVSIEHLDQQTQAPGFATEINHDRYEVLRVGIDWQRPIPWGAVFQIKSIISQGLGGRTEKDAIESGIPLSQQGAGPDFTKYNFSGRLSQPLAEDLKLDFISRAQLSFGRALLTSEQFALDGSDAISPLASGAISVDTGATIRGELTRSFLVPTATVPMLVSPYVFAAKGWGVIEKPTAVQRASISAGAFGVGVYSSVRQTGDVRSGSLGLEIGKEFASIAGEKAGYRANFTVMLGF